jgi:hypothetical protein
VTRRAKGDGGLSWDAARERWVASATIGYDGRGKRIVRRGRGRTKTEAKNKLRQLLRDLEDGLVVANDGYTVAQAVEDWLTYGLSNRDPATQELNRRLCEKHVIPLLGARRLRDLKASEVDAWLTELSTTLSTRTLQARDRVRRNVVELTELPTGQPGRPSKAMSVQQADDVLIKTAVARLHPIYRRLAVDRRGLRGCGRCAGSTCILRAGRRLYRRSRRTSRSGARCVRRVIPRRDAPGGRLRYLVGASTRSGHSVCNRLQIGWPPGHRGRSRGWSSQRQWAVRWIQRTSALICVGALKLVPAWSRRIGRRASCGTPSCPFCRMQACRSRLSRSWSATAVPASLRSCIGIRLGRSFRRARP